MWYKYDVLRHNKEHSSNDLNNYENNTYVLCKMKLIDMSKHI